MTNEMPLQALYNEALMGLAQGKSEMDMVAALTFKGVPEVNAKMMVAAAHQEKRAAIRKAGLEAAMKGFGLLALGVLITAGTASMKGSFFIVAWGPMIFGGWMMLKGLFRALVG